MCRNSLNYWFLLKECQDTRKTWLDDEWKEKWEIEIWGGEDGVGEVIERMLDKGYQGY